MPRKRQTQLDKLMNNIHANTAGQIVPANDLEKAIQEMATRGRPKKLNKPEHIEDATVTPVANGYVVTSTTTGKNMFVFESIDKAFDFVRTSLKPTAEQAEFLTQV